MGNKNIVAFIFLLLCLSGCTGKYTHKSFEPENIDRITILPFLDRRENPDPDINFEQMSNYGYRIMNQILKYSKHYRTVSSSDIGNVSSYSVQDLPSSDEKSGSEFSVDPESVDSGWIKQLGPVTEKWLLVPVVESISFTNLLLQMHASARVSAYLFNKSTGELWWYCSNEASWSSGALVHAISIGLSSEDNVLESTAIVMANQGCIDLLPKRNGPYVLNK